MRYILIILFFLSVGANAQMVIKAHANYRPTAQPAANLLLDDYPNAAAAYSLRKLDKDYTGAAIRVRKDTTGQPESDIFFTDAGNLDTTALKNFVGNNSGWVVTWYDQSGSGRNASQSTAANQSRIVNAGVIERADENPAVRFRNGASEFLSNSTNITNTTASIFVVSKLVTSGTNQTRGQFGLASNTTGTYIRISNFTNTLRGGIRNPASSSGERSINYSIVSNPTKMYLSSYFIISTTSREFFVDGTSVGTNTLVTATITSNNIVIGKAETTDANGIDGFISEIVFYSSDQTSNRSNIQTNLNSYYTIY